jgi:predicted O-linked N-acetylglucosamine transferase (SPINDLY family)
MQEGMESVRLSIAADPMQPAAYSALGNALRILNRPEEALEQYRRALALDPRHVPALNNRGSALLDLGRPLEALESYECALRLKPHHTGALVNLGNALALLGRSDEALAAYERAIQLQPGFGAALAGRGRALLVLRRLDEALGTLEECLAVSPHDAQVHHDRADVLLESWRPEDAVRSYERALELDPARALTLYKRSIALVQLGRHGAAAASFARLLEIAPEYPFALGGLLWSRLMLCDWADWAQTTERAIAGVASGRPTIIPFALLAVSGSPQTQLQCTRAYASAGFAAAPEPLPREEAYRHERIRVAYMSADFGSHPVSALLVQVFELHDRRRFATTAISLQPAEPGPFGERVSSACDEFIDASRMNDREVAAMIRAREVDILVDLMGYTTGSRTAILAQRPAPVQVNFLGFPGTMGAPYMDYIVADARVIPESLRPFYLEKVAYLPNCFQPNDARRAIAPRAASRAASGLPEGAFVFCCFNNHYKISPPVFSVWMRLLRAVESAVLWLPGGSDTLMANLRREAAARDIAPRRLVFAPKLPDLADHLARYRLADLFLDTLPYNAHTTASDALWAGLPLLTCRGNSFAARVAASLLETLGLPELIADDLPSYEERAHRLATQPALLRALRERLAGNLRTSRLFDTVRYTGDLEALLEKMVGRHQAHLPPDHIE